MGEGLSKERLALFDRIVRSFGVAIKNNVLYPRGHPSLKSSIDSFSEALNKWFTQEEALELGITQDNLLLGGEAVREDSALYKEVADYLHHSGLMAIAFSKGLEAKELEELFRLLKKEVKEVPRTPHIAIKETDYSTLLRSGQGASAETKEEDIWRTLCQIGEDSRSGRLPDTKAEFLENFLKDTKASARVLNKIYKDAVAKLEEKKTTDEIRGVFARVVRYFEGRPPEDAKESRRLLADIIVKLGPNLVAGILEEAKVDGRVFDFSREILKDFSDEMISKFIASLIESQGIVNENLIKVFDKFVAGKPSPAAIVSQVFDSLAEKGFLDKGVLSRFESSVKNIFDIHRSEEHTSE